MKYFLLHVMPLKAALAASTVDDLADSVVSTLGLKNNHSLSFTSNNTVKLIIILLIIMFSLFVLDKLVSVILKHKSGHFAVPACITTLFLAASTFLNINNSMFYTVSQLTIFVTSLFYLVFAFSKDKHIYTTVFIALAVLYNPFAALPLGSVTWKTVDICALVFFSFYSIAKMRR